MQQNEIKKIEEKIRQPEKFEKSFFIQKKKLKFC